MRMISSAKEARHGVAINGRKFKASNNSRHPCTQEQLRERKGRHGGLLGELQASRQNEISLTDADSRRMKGAHGEHCMGCNVRVAARPEIVAQRKTIVEHSEPDRRPGLRLQKMCGKVFAQSGKEAATDTIFRK